jgi:hypothetical protein
MTWELGVTSKQSNGSFYQTPPIVSLMFFSVPDKTIPEKNMHVQVGLTLKDFNCDISCLKDVRIIDRRNAR